MRAAQPIAGAGRDRRPREHARRRLTRHRADALRARRRRRPQRLPPPLRARSADRPLAAAPAVAARRSPPGAVRGARLGRLRAADRVRARRSDRAPSDRAAGRRWLDWHGAPSLLRDAPTAQALAGTAPAMLESCDLAAGRAITLVRVAREVALGRVDLNSSDHERRLAASARDPRIGAGRSRCSACWPGPPRPAPGRRPRSAEARRPVAERRRPQARAEEQSGARVLRALRGVGGAGGDARSAGRRDSSAAAVASPLVKVGAVALAFFSVPAAHARASDAGSRSSATGAQARREP